MNLYLDAETNGFRGQLLSLALIPEAMEYPPFYLELELYESPTNWVKLNVLPKMQYSETTPPNFQHEIEKYLQQFDKVNIVAKSPDELEHFIRLLIVGPGKRIKMPPMRFQIVPSDAVSHNPHHALDDALALRDYCLNNLR